MELLHVDEAFAAGTADHRHSTQDVADRGKVFGRVGLAQGTANGSAVADHRIRDDRFGVRNNREESGYFG
ncbi:hypothetical protein D9M72_518530 [compost metagenome]